MLKKIVCVLAILLKLQFFGTCFEIQPRIVNGFPSSKRGEFPFYVLLELTERFYPKENFICGATLISETFVLTAAHCLHENVTKVLIHLGSLRQGEHEKGRHVFFARKKHFYLHPEWDRENMLNDIALIKLSRPAAYSRLIQPVKLPNICDLPSEKEMIAIGNGYNETHGDRAEILQYTTLITVPYSKCAEYYDLFDSESILCARGNENGSSICRGDSGGALIDPIDHQIFGISSFVDHDKGCSGAPQGFTNVISYLPWISEITGINIPVDC